MTPEQWKKLRYFYPWENWGDSDKMSFELLLKMDAMRAYAGKVITILSGYREGDKGQHGLGKAVDWRIRGLNLVDQFLIAKRFCWPGLGLYSENFVHTDVRELKPNEPAARWVRINGIYLPFDKVNLKKLLF